MYLLANSLVIIHVQLFLLNVARSGDVLCVSVSICLYVCLTGVNPRLSGVSHC